MTGPPYPNPNPVPWSNAIGTFVIGVSPIGTIPTFNWWQTVISQYANSPVITSLIGSFFSAEDLTQEFDAFYDDIWNVLTAQGYGLDVWGRIVGVGRTFRQLNPTLNFGFQEATTVNATPFNVAPFYSGPQAGPPQEGSFSLTDTQFRLLILAKAAFNISDGSIPSINQLLLSLFPGRGNVYVTDNGNMTMTYTFKFPISSNELAMLVQSGVLPKPSGVAATIVQV